jgi:hypothetical protein
MTQGVPEDRAESAGPARVGVESGEYRAVCVYSSTETAPQCDLPDRSADQRRPRRPGGRGLAVRTDQVAQAADGGAMTQCERCKRPVSGTEYNRTEGS